MNYHVTCVCGQSFDIPDTQLGSPSVCPACQRTLVPVPAAPSPPPSDSAPLPAAAPADTLAEELPTPSAVQPTKACPYCGETILAVARKCRFCHELLDRAAPPSTAAAPAGTASAPAGQTATDAEPPVFALSVSQWDNFFRYLICAVVVVVAGVVLFYLLPLLRDDIPYRGTIFTLVVLVTAFAAYLYFMGARNARCIVRPARIQTESGIFTRQVDSLEMFRIRDVELQRRNLFQRLLGIGTITLYSTDVTSPQLELYQIPQVRKVFEYIQTQIPKADKERGSVHIQQ